jgi:hypothetical protein
MRAAERGGQGPRDKRDNLRRRICTPLTRVLRPVSAGAAVMQHRDALAVGTGAHVIHCVHAGAVLHQHRNARNIASLRSKVQRRAAPLCASTAATRKAVTASAQHGIARGNSAAERD